MPPIKADYTSEEMIIIIPTVTDKRPPVLYLPDGKVLVRKIGF